MIKVFFLFCLIISDLLAFEDKNISNLYKQSVDQLNSTISTNNFIYTIQLQSFKRENTNETSLVLESMKLLVEDQDDLYIYPLGRYDTIRYKKSFSKDKIYEYLNKLKQKDIFKDAIVKKVPKERLEKYLSRDKKNDTKDQEDSYQFACIKQQSFEFEKLSSYQYTNLLNQADKYKRSSMIIQSIESYEKLFASDQKNNIVNNNLFFLYGLSNNWPKAKEKFCLLKDLEKLIYSYALGALQINNPNLNEELNEVINEDRSGYINLVMAVFYERKENFSEAFRYYKKAYDLNRSDSFLTFAYARVCEIQDRYDDAIFLYNLILQNTQDENIKQQSLARIKNIQLIKEIDMIKRKLIEEEAKKKREDR